MFLFRKRESADVISIRENGGTILHRNDGVDIPLKGYYLHGFELNGHIFLRKKDGTTDVYDDQLKVVCSLNYFLYRDGCGNGPDNMFIISRRGKLSIAGFLFDDFSIAEEHVLSSYYKQYEVVSQELVVGFKSRSIECCNFINGKVQWIYEWNVIDEHVEVPIGLWKCFYNETLYFTCNLSSLGRVPLLCRVKLNGGSVEVLQEEFPQKIIMKGDSLVSVGLPSNIIYYQLSIDSKAQLGFVDALEAAGLHEIDQRLWEIRGDELLFYQGKGSHNAMVAILDMKGRVVKCKHKFAAKHGAMAQMHWAGDMVYCLMQDGTLHRIEILR
jgi:hypothetical protein